MDEYWKWDDNSWNFGEKSTEICRKMKDHQQVMNDFHKSTKIQKATPKTLRVLSKNEKDFQNFKIILRLFKISMENSLFSHFLLNISWISDSSPKVYIPGR